MLHLVVVNGGDTETNYHFEAGKNSRPASDATMLCLVNDCLTISLSFRIEIETQAASLISRLQETFPSFNSLEKLEPRSASQNNSESTSTAIALDLSDSSSMENVILSLQRDDLLLFSGEIGDIRIQKHPLDLDMLSICFVFWISEDLPGVTANIFKYLAGSLAIPELVEQIRSSIDEHIVLIKKVLDVVENPPAKAN